MLVLSRHQNESIVIGDDVVITVIEIRRNGTVKLGITAPAEKQVNRLELAETKGLPVPPIRRRSPR